MSKLLWRYFIYFVIFITMVQVFEYNGTQELFAKCGIKVDFSLLGTYAPLFLSVLLIDVTYRIGKRQNQIAEQQYKIAKFDNYRDLHRDIYKCKCMFEAILPKIYEYYIATDREVQKNSIDDYFTKLTELLFSIQNGVSDAMLRGDMQLNVDKVRDLLNGAGAILMYVSSHPIRHANTQDFFAALYMGAEFREKRTLEEQAEYINELANDPNLKAGMDMFVKDYKAVFEGENNILAQLQKLYNE